MSFMKVCKYYLLIVGVMVVLPVMSAFAQKAPELEIQEWLRGESVKRFEKGRHYVLDFASVSCPSCRKSIPLLAALTQKYQDQVTFINIYSSEYNKLNDFRYVANAKAMFEKMKTQMPFAVAIDKDGRSSMRKYDVSGWPTLILIDEKGEIVWRGYDLHVLDAELGNRLSARNTLANEKSRQEFEQSLGKLAGLVQQNKLSAASDLIDSLSGAFPLEAPTLLIRQFKLWIGKDDARAYRLVRHALDQRDDVVWEKLISPAWTGTKVPDFPVVLQLIDRALAEAPTPEIKQALRIQKTQILRDRALRNLDSAHYFLKQAVSVLEQVQDIPMLPELQKQNSNTLLELKYLIAVASSTPAADQIQALQNNQPSPTTWMRVTDAVLRLNNTTAFYEVLPWVKEKYDEALLKSEPQLLARSGHRLVQLYHGLASHQHAQFSCNQLIEYFTTTGNTAKAKTFEHLRAELY